jgi:hypothetical protein
MDYISARLTQLSTQRAIRGFVALLVTSVTFWCLVSGDDALQNSSSHHSDGGSLAPRGTAKIQTPGAITGLVVGTMLGVLAIGVSVWLFYCVNRLRVYHCSCSTVETRCQSEGDRPRENYRPYSVQAAEPHLSIPWVPPGTSVIVGVQEPDNFEDLSSWTPRYGEIDLLPILTTMGPWSVYSRREVNAEGSAASKSKGILSTYSLRDFDAAGRAAGPPMQFWKPTEMERDLASRISLDEGSSLAIPTAAKQAPPKASEYDPVFKLSSPDLESKILLPESITPVLAFS